MPQIKIPVFLPAIVFLSMSSTPTHARKYGVKGYTYFDILGGSYGSFDILGDISSRFVELHFVRGAVGYGPLLIGSELGEVRYLPIRESYYFVCSFPIQLYVVGYGKVWKRPKVDFVIPVIYFYAGGSAWGMSYFDISRFCSARYLEMGVAFSPGALIDFRLGYLIYSFDYEPPPITELRGVSSNTIYASVGLEIAAWLHYDNVNRLISYLKFFKSVVDWI